jgi:hypothetical protein
VEEKIIQQGVKIASQDISNAFMGENLERKKTFKWVRDQPGLAFFIPSLK